MTVHRPLTATEERIVRLVLAGRTNPQVAEELGISRQTVEWHLWRTYRKLGVHTREHLAERIASESPLGPPHRSPLGAEGPKDGRPGPLRGGRTPATYDFQQGSRGRKR